MRKHIVRFSILFLMATMLSGFLHLLHGENPPRPDSLSELTETATKAIDRLTLQASAHQEIRSLFVRGAKGASNVLVMLVAYDQEISSVTRSVLGSNQTPLIFSVSTLPFTSGDFQPMQLRFEQDGKSWQPGALENTEDVMPLGKLAKFGGILSDGEIHLGMVLLPEWIAVERPLSIIYGNHKKVVNFN